MESKYYLCDECHESILGRGYNHLCLKCHSKKLANESMDKLLQTRHSGFIEGNKDKLMSLADRLNRVGKP